MRSIKANFAGLTSPLQHAEMKSILGGAWPPLKPLPVFKYETAEYRATIDFDRKRGEWVCRKISLPSNEVQELRGGLREITVALPHGEAETFIEIPEHQEHEFEKDTNRRLQAMQEWREKYANGALYSELRDYLSESQRIEIDDSLRLSLTARQLQFNPKNLADVFDDLSVAGGRFAMLIELAKRNKAKQKTAPQAQEEGAVPKAEPAIDHDRQSPAISSCEVGPILDNGFVRDKEAAEPCTGSDQFPAVSMTKQEIASQVPGEGVLPEAEPVIDRDKQSPEISSWAFGPILDDRFVQPQEAAEPCTGADEFPAVLIAKQETASQAPGEAANPEAERAADADEFPAVSIKNIFPEPDEASVSERMPPHAASQQFEIETPEVVDADAPSLVEHLYQEGHDSPTTASLPAQVPTDQSSADRIEGSFLRFPALEISGFQVAVIALLFLSTVIAFTVGLKAGRGPLGRRREAPKLMLSAYAKSPVTPPDQVYESTPQTPTPSVASSNASAAAHRPDDATPSEEKSRENTRGSEYLAQVGSIDSDSSPATESKPSAKPELNPEHSAAIEPIVPISPGPNRPTPAIATAAAAPHLPRSSPILVTVRSGGSQRVSFPERAIAATSSVAMASQLSVLVSSEPWPTVAHKSARLEAGKLVSFVWPRYARPRYGLAETIRVRATIGQLGQVQEVKFLSGSVSLLPATTRAIRQWRYQPTLLDKRPVQAQQDVTIEFRPPQYSSKMSAHPSHN